MKFSISIENFNPDLDNSPQKGALLCGSLESFILDWKFQSAIGRSKTSNRERNIENLHSLGPLGKSLWLRKHLVTLRFHCDFCGTSLRLRTCEWQSLAICDCDYGSVGYPSGRARAQIVIAIAWITKGAWNWNHLSFWRFSPAKLTICPCRPPKWPFL